MNFRLNLRLKLFFSILLILFLSYATLIYSTVKSINVSLQQKISRDLENDLKYIREQYATAGIEIKGTLLPPATAPPVISHVRNKDAVWLTDAINRWHKILPAADFIVVTDESGTVLASRTDQMRPERLNLAPLQQARITRVPVVSTELVSYKLLRLAGDLDYTASLSGGEAMMITVAIPVLDDKEKVLGVIVAGDVMNRDCQFLNNVQHILGEMTNVTVTQREVKIASTGQKYSLPTTLAPEVLSRLEKKERFKGETTIGSVTYLTAFEPIEDLAGKFIGSISVAMSTEDIKSIRNTNLRNIFNSASVGILLAFIMAYFVARRMTQPLMQLAESAQKIERGDYELKIGHTGDPDYDMLVHSFNKMVTTLEERDRTIKKKTLDLQTANACLKELNELLERKVAERTAELQMEMGRLEAILTSMAEGVIVTDRDNTVIVFNPVAQKMFNIVPHRVIGHLIEDICASGSLCVLAECVAEMREAGSEASARETNVVIQGRNLRININAMLDRNGQFAGVVMSLRDVTLELEINQMRSDFISTVSHELKTPLTSMKGSLQLVLMKGEGMTETERDLLAVCLRNTERLIRLISEILDLSRIEAGAISFSFKASSIVELINYSIQEIRAFALDHDITIVDGVMEPLPLVYVDPDRLVQVITNLLANAVKFSPEGKAVVVTARRETHYIAVSVEDKGQPIQWSDRTKLFKKFQQFETAGMKGRGGTGLGLAICREIIEKHHGKIFYHPRDGEGNVFTFTVPVFEEQ